MPITIYHNGKMIPLTNQTKMRKIFQNRLLKKTYVKIPEVVRMRIIEKSCKQVSRGVFFSTTIIVASFLPVFLLTGQEGKLFSPLAFTKTFIIAVDYFICISAIPHDYYSSHNFPFTVFIKNPQSFSAG